MPQGDGTGPRGQGPASGRQRGGCSPTTGNGQAQPAGRGMLARFGNMLRRGGRQQAAGTQSGGRGRGGGQGQGRNR